MARELLGTPLPTALTEPLSRGSPETRCRKVAKTDRPHRYCWLSRSIPRVRESKSRADQRRRLCNKADLFQYWSRLSMKSTVTKRLRIASPTVRSNLFRGESPFSLTRQGTAANLGPTEIAPPINHAAERSLLAGGDVQQSAHDVESQRSGRRVCPRTDLFEASRGRREATIGFDVDQGNQGLGISCRKRRSCSTCDPADARQIANSRRSMTSLQPLGLTFPRPGPTRFYPPQARRFGPPISFFQQQIYRPGRRPRAAPSR